MVTGVFLTVLFMHRSKIPSVTQIIARSLPGAFGIGNHEKLL